jgi:hypothetical protein
VRKIACKYGLAPAALIAFAFALTAATAQESPAADGTRVSAADSICLMLESAARANGLPLEFFARLIHAESSFRADATGPLTRSGQRAQGIAQFMPGTAAERNLLDPYDPVQALPKSAEFLRELRQRFGNLGLAAAAYNAGPRRVEDWIAGRGNLPAETQNYVLKITGRPAEDWANPPKGVSRPQEGGTATAGDCRTVTAMLRRAPTPFMDELEKRIVTASISPWGVQLSGSFSRSIALASYARAAHAYRGVLAGHDPILLRSVMRTRGPRAFFQVRIGTNDRSSADTLCSKLRKAGGACLVLRNRGRAG